MRAWILFPAVAFPLSTSLAAAADAPSAVAVGKRWILSHRPGGTDTIAFATTTSSDSRLALFSRSTLQQAHLRNGFEIADTGLWSSVAP